MRYLQIRRFVYTSDDEVYIFTILLKHVTRVCVRTYILSRGVTWIRGRAVRALGLVLKGSEYNPFVRPSVVKIANHC